MRASISVCNQSKCSSLVCNQGGCSNRSVWCRWVDPHFIVPTLDFLPHPHPPALSTTTAAMLGQILFAVCVRALNYISIKVQKNECVWSVNRKYRKKRGKLLVSELPVHPFEILVGFLPSRLSLPKLDTRYACLFGIKMHTFGLNTNTPSPWEFVPRVDQPRRSER